MPLDATTTRLAALRRTDRTGFWAGDDPASGQDGSGAVTVTVDPTNRITEVAVRGRADHLRTPELLAAAVDEAAGAARAARLRAGRAGSDVDESTTRDRRAVARPLGIGVQAVENFQETGTTPSGRLRGTSGQYLYRDLDGGAVGQSDNGCVTVVLDLASSHGRLHVDSGWLANAPSKPLGAAITQAYRNAYRKQDRS
ncbi:MAG TPA: hypothetical protein VFO49_14575 [Nocardioides sp.]|nr:hypothetical protein [Nocardioides sp.]